ncbi:hypothetical protein [Maridesulfovibrio sp. FT414]|uniref:hypothetical protein n=1 Tax=Maridesulfovibrio sp. FT414 TaxID=2979469 RepID=UPI003D805DE8
MRSKILFYSLLVVLMLAAGCARTRIPSPRGMGEAPYPGGSPVDVLAYFEGIPYRGDGAINHHGDFTLFATPEILFSKPGLNCSGFTVAASRYLFRRNLLLNDMTIDRLGDSGKDSPYGQDWDFGYDVVLNVTEGMNRKVMLPFGETAQIEGSNGMTLRGFELHDRDAWRDVISRMRPGMIYLFSMNKPVSFKNYTLLHYHVGLIVPDDKGHVWLCHATTKGGVNKADITDQAALDRIINANPDGSLGPRSILIIEVPSRVGFSAALNTITK